jgi:hypothetical protein
MVLLLTLSASAQFASLPAWQADMEPCPVEHTAVEPLPIWGTLTGIFQRIITAPDSLTWFCKLPGTPSSHWSISYFDSLHMKRMWLVFSDTEEVPPDSLNGLPLVDVRYDIKLGQPPDSLRTWGVMYKDPPGNPTVEVTADTLVPGFYAMTLWRQFYDGLFHRDADTLYFHVEAP